MKRARNSMSMAVMLVGSCLMLTSDAWTYTGTGGIAGGTPTCVIPKADPNKHTLKLTGTVAINVTSNIDILASRNDVDVVVRLQEKSGAPRFYRLHLYTPFNNLSNQERACRIFNPADDPTDIAVQQAVRAFVNKIISDFQLPFATRFVFLGVLQDNGTFDTSQAIYNGESPTAVLVIPGSTNNVPGGAPFLPGNPITGIPPGDHAGSMIDITVYAEY